MLYHAKKIEKRYLETFKTENMTGKDGKPVKITNKSVTKPELIEAYIEQANKGGKLKPEIVYFSQLREQAVTLSASAAAARSASRGPMPPTYPDTDFPPVRVGRSSSRAPAKRDDASKKKKKK